MYFLRTELDTESATADNISMNPNHTEESQMSPQSEQPVEVAYRFPGVSWKRKTFASNEQFQRWVSRQDDDIEVRFREA
jgi:hypothetical protein